MGHLKKALFFLPRRGQEVKRSIMTTGLIVKEGYRYIAFLFLLTVMVAFFAEPVWSILPGVLTLFVTFFFRNPNRIIPTGDNLVLSPADGKVMSVCEVTDEEFLHTKGTKVTIFLSVFDVHVNRSPIGGEIKYQQYVCGRFKPAYKASAGCENERHAIGLDNGRLQVLVTQVAGLIARRIVSWVTLGSQLHSGECFGMIKFGSRVDLYLPENYSPIVSIGESVFAGQTVIAQRKQY